MDVNATAAHWFAGLSLFALLVPCVHGEPASPAIRKTITVLSQQLMDALPVGAKPVWQHIVDDDALVIDEFGRRQTKADIVASLHPFPTGFSGSIEIRNAQVNLYDDTAVIVCEEYERETVFGQKFAVRYIGTNTFVRRQGQWKLLAMATVTLPTTPPKLQVAGLPMRDYPGVYRYGPGHAWTVALDADVLSYTTKPTGPAIALEPIAKDVFMEGNDEKNLLIFRRDASGQVVAMIERRKFNDLELVRESEMKRATQ